MPDLHDLGEGQLAEQQVDGDEELQHTPANVSKLAGQPATCGWICTGADSWRMQIADLAEPGRRLMAWLA